MFFWKKKNRPNFFELLTKQCDSMLSAMTALHSYCKTGDEAYAETVIRIEMEADKQKQQVIDELNDTFITPIERKDIFDLARFLDEIINYTKTTVDEIRIFALKPNDDLTAMAYEEQLMSEHIRKAIANMEKNKNIAMIEARSAKKIENIVGAMCTQALVNLLANTDDCKMIIKYREVYRHINKTADIGDAAMDCLLDVLVSM